MFIVIPDGFFRNVCKLHQLTGRVITFFFHETGSFRTFIIRKNAGQSNREFPERYCDRKKEEEEGFLPEERCVTL